MLALTNRLQGYTFFDKKSIEGNEEYFKRFKGIKGEFNKGISSIF